LTWLLADDVTDDVLEQRLFGRAGVATSRRRRIEPDWAALARELKRPGVTMMILWEEYREINRDGYGCSRFRDLLRAAPNGAFRACNGVHNTFALERHTDEIAARFGMDPLAFRRRAALGDKDVGATGQVFDGDVLRPMLDKMAELRGPSRNERELADRRPVGRATTVGTWSCSSARPPQPSISMPTVRRRSSPRASRSARAR
jgi:hypothetical protein